MRLAPVRRSGALLLSPSRVAGGLAMTRSAGGVRRSGASGPQTVVMADAQRSPPGFDELFREEYPRLLRVLTVACADREAAADLAQDRPVAEVATLLGLAEGTVKSHLHDGRRTLARSDRLAPEEDR